MLSSLNGVLGCLVSFGVSCDVVWFVLVCCSACFGLWQRPFVIIFLSLTRHIRFNHSVFDRDFRLFRQCFSYWAQHDATDVYSFGFCFDEPKKHSYLDHFFLSTDFTSRFQPLQFYSGSSESALTKYQTYSFEHVWKPPVLVFHLQFTTK